MVQNRYLSKGPTNVINLALGDQAQACIATINKYLQNNGLEWTTARLKDLRTGIYQLKAGNTDIVRSIWRNSSIAHHKCSLIPKGIYGHICKMYLHATNHQVIRRIDAVLRVYTSMRLSKLSYKQYSKAKDAINGVGVDESDYTEIYHAVRREASYLDLPKVGNPDFSRLRVYSSTHKVGTFPKDILDKPWGKHVASLWTSVYIPEELKGLNPAEEMRSLMESSGADSTTAGHIAFIQESGCKARVIAVPNAWIQTLLTPYERSLDHIIKSLPESCCHDQVKGAYYLKNSLSHGKKVFCYDLSSATDRFPLLLQKGVLTSLGLSNIAEAIDKIAHSNWSVNTEFGDETWCYQVGQPMGMYCSFKLFHLTHILLLRAIEHGIEPTLTDTFRVLGDDVIITDPQVASVYVKWMERIGVELSSSKSIVSCLLGEFAGFVALRTTKGVFIHRPLKYSGCRKMGSPMSLIYSLGKRICPLSNWWKNAYEIFRLTIKDRNPDLSPVVREDSDLTVCEPINSHLLGSLSNYVSYFIGYQPSEELLGIYELNQINLLGKKEIINVDGFASKENNLLAAYPREIENAVNRKDDFISNFKYQLSLTKDPLYRSRLIETRQEPVIVTS